MVVTGILIALSLLGLSLLSWQWLAAMRFPLHQRPAGGLPRVAVPVTLLKPVKGCDEATADCLRSWFNQSYDGPVQILVGVASADDPVCAVVRGLIQTHPGIDAELVICSDLSGVNAKVAKLSVLQQKARHPFLVISDADVFAPPDLLSNLLGQIAGRADVGLVNCFYELAEARGFGERWEAVATNSDFWSQVLQSNSLKPMDFALGAVMAVRREALEKIGGFPALANCLADDYQIGNRIAHAGFKVQLSPIVVECRGGPGGWIAAWKHQLRWARTIRVCQPVPYFFSILGNAGLWPLFLIAARPHPWAFAVAAGCWAVRLGLGAHLLRRLERKHFRWSSVPLLLLKDWLHAAVWLMAFVGNTVEWRGRKMLLRRDGTVAHMGDVSA